MKIKFTTAESAFCPRLKTREGHEEHISQPHFHISPLPSPAEPLEISSFPIAIHSETSNFNPKSIANLCLQLLVIQVQNANFWNFADIARVQNDKFYKKSLAAGQTDNDTKLEKLVFFLRCKLQEGFLHQPPQATDMQEMSKFIKMLEDASSYGAQIILRTKIHKVLIRICKLDLIPGDEVFNFRERCEILIAEWRKTLENHRQGTNLRFIPDPISKSVEPQPTVNEEPPEKIEEVDPMPALCITQLTPEQCAKVEILAQGYNPPLNRAVVELICMLPQISAQNEPKTYHIVPFGELVNPVQNRDEKCNPERKLGGWGPKIPTHILQLTKWGGGYGRSHFVDTRTGEGIVFKEYRLTDHTERDPKWEHIVSDRKPIEELLQEWIDKFLEGMLMLNGGGTAVYKEGPRYNVNILMDNLKHNVLIREYGWPESFPLLAPQYRELCKRNGELFWTTFYINPQQNSSLDQIWGRLSTKWRFTDNPLVKYDKSDRHQNELLSSLDRSIGEALKYDERQIKDREYALAAGVPMQKSLLQALASGFTSSSGEDWRVEVTPEMIVKRFEEVVAAGSEAVDEDTGKMRVILERAYERWKLQEQGIQERD